MHYAAHLRGCYFAVILLLFLRYCLTMIYLTVTCLVAHGQGALILIRISRFLRASVSEAYGKVYLGNADRHL